MQEQSIETSDPYYVARRAEIATLADRCGPDDPIPTIKYTEEEHEVWRLVCEKLAARHRTDASNEYLEAAEGLAVPRERIPQLRDISRRIDSLSGFRFRSAPALVPFRDFCNGLAGSVFHSTQYLRHPGTPFYTADPDMLHDVVGHGNVLGDKRFARLYRLAGEAAARAESEAALQFIAKVFWFTLECGLIRQQGTTKAYGATIVSSYGELNHFRGADIRPLDLKSLADVDYDISTYQKTLFEADSMDHLEDVVGGFWETCDDNTIEALLELQPFR
ncbi:phenylalanine 4-monooxygenase [Micromonospora sp. ALFpr18c]|uniref:phenylalanine 4-monooxygenase n=1 Tax=Micromonospora sp. ALFpr18c TaxID=1458665 RepID=UPI00124B7F76|nr:phenylalanine 4-monooxygenase [Micromonospora sp. ALFpr18c]KAB1943836.1 phenylalanine 4-monooxygenase [Micromonospora sp. ALFpr18c]